MSGRLRLALQKSGRLADRSLELLKSAGLRVRVRNDELLQRVENQPIDILRIRDDDIPTFVAGGVADFGIVGLNVLEEHAGEPGVTLPDQVMRLGFGRCTLKIAVPVDHVWSGPDSLSGLRVATSYPNLLRRWLAGRGVSAEVVKLSGAVEVAPRLKMAQAICDLVSTGATLEANGLRAVETVLESEAVLVRRPGAIDPDLAHVAELLIARVQGVTASQDTKYILLNAPVGALAEIAAVLPGAGSPTVTPLAGREDAVAVHAVCQESVFWETLERLKAAGAPAILVLPIEKMML